jgi:hypothetical protein
VTLVLTTTLSSLSLKINYNTSQRIKLSTSIFAKNITKEKDCVMGKKRGLPVGVWIFTAVVIMAKIGDAPTGIWILIGVLAFVCWLIRSSKVKMGPGSAQPQQPSVANQWQHPRNQSSEVIVKAAKENQKSYRIPASPKNINMPSRWLSEGESIEVAGMKVSGGLIYVGSNLKAASGGVEPALIDPAKPVSRNTGDFTERLTGYWANYSDISPEARRAYLLWLADGKNILKPILAIFFCIFTVWNAAPYLMRKVMWQQKWKDL